MTRALYIALILLAANTVSAQDDDDPESGLVSAHLIGDPSTVAAPTLRPQLVKRDHSTAPIIGGIAAVTGGVALVGSFALYVARQNYRLRPWRTVSDSTVHDFELQGAWSFWMGVGASSLLVTSEYLLLPESAEVPTLAWFAGAGGLAVAAVGVGFAVGGSHCGPQAIRPGADLILACDAGTSDALFGNLLLLTSLPLINIPLTYLLRRAFAGAPDSLTLGPGGVTLLGRF